MAIATNNLRIRLPVPHPGQRRVRQELRRFNWLCAGRRWRKTTLGMALVVEDLLAGKTSLWTAPTFDQVRVAWSELKAAGLGTLRFQHSEMYASLDATGGRCYFRSLDNPDNARGHTVTGRVYMDEAAQVDETAWYEVLRPMLIDSGGGALFLFTPQGRNWVWREWEAARDRSDAMAWQAPTLGARVFAGQIVRQPHPLENPDVPFSELEDMFASTPERVFRQEILAEFLEAAGGVFGDLRPCIGGPMPTNPQPMHGHEYLAGVDLAKHNDYTVVSIIDQRERRQVYFQRWNKSDWPLTKAKIAAILEFWGNPLCTLDATGVGDPIHDDLARAGLRVQPYVFTTNSKRELINNAVLLLEQRQVQLLDIPTQTAELAAYEYERLPAGGLRMNAPQGLHDDCVIALALSLWPLSQQSAGVGALAGLLFDDHHYASDFRGADLMRRKF